jgi:hypothetical protein
MVDVPDRDPEAPSDLEETLPPRSLLESYTVSELPVDFTDRVMASLHAGVAPSPAPSRAPWIFAAASSACAIAACVALVLSQRQAPPPTPEPAAPAVAVVAPPPAAPPPAAGPRPAAAPVAVRPSGDVIVQVDPPDAIVRVDGVRIVEASGSPFVRTNLLVGPHLVEVEREGYRSWSQRIDVPAHALPLSVALQPLSPAALVPPGTPRRPKRHAAKAAGDLEGSPDLKNPFGAPEDPTRPPGPSSPDLDDPFGK